MNPMVSSTRIGIPGVNFRVPLSRIGIGGVNPRVSLTRIGIPGVNFSVPLPRIGIGGVNFENSLYKNWYLWCEA